MTIGSPSAVRSAICTHSPSRFSNTCVPTGTASVMSSPDLPVRSEPSPCEPFRASNVFWKRKLRRVFRLARATRWTLPPCPPSPPSGPPRLAPPPPHRGPRAARTSRGGNSARFSRRVPPRRGSLLRRQTLLGARRRRCAAVPSSASLRLLHYARAAPLAPLRRDDGSTPGEERR